MKMKTKKKPLVKSKKLKKPLAKSKNPTDYEFLKHIKIDKNDDGKFIIYYIIYNGLPIGDACYNKINGWVGNINIDKEHQRKGLATYLYNYIEKEHGVILRPSRTQLGDGDAFWKNRLKRNPDQEIVKQQLDNLLLHTDVGNLKKVVIMSDPYLFGTLNKFLKSDNIPNEYIYILTVKYETVRSTNKPIFSRSEPGIRETFELYEFDINDVIKIDGRKIYLTKHPKLFDKYTAGKRR